MIITAIGDLKVKLGRYRITAAIGLWLFFAATIILPLTVIVVTSFLKVWGLQWIPGNFTLDNYRQLLFTEPRILKAIVNSVVFGFIAASVATVIGSIIYRNQVWGLQRETYRFSSGGRRYFGLDKSTPKIVRYALDYYCYLCGGQLAIGDSEGPGILVDSLDPELGETAWTFGASTLTGFKKVVAPLIKPGLKAGWICSFLFALHEIPVSTLLAAPGTETVGVILFGLRSDTGDWS